MAGTSNRTSNAPGPISLMRQGLDEIERWWSSSSRSWMSGMAGAGADWMPAVEAFQRGSEFVVRVEAPGMRRQDLTVELAEDSLTISGERRREQRDERDGTFWTERQYGSFSRTIPLPPGTIGDSAKASFHDGVLEIVMQAPSKEARRGRRVDISGT